MHIIVCYSVSVFSEPVARSAMMVVRGIIGNYFADRDNDRVRFEPICSALVSAAPVV